MKAAHHGLATSTGLGDSRSLKNPEKTIFKTQNFIMEVLLSKVRSIDSRN
jgi:hypothetical protein